MKQCEVPVTSAVRPLGGVPTLFVNDRPVPGAAYMIYYTHKNRYADFAAAGYSLFSVPAFFATRPINDANSLPPFRPGMFDDPLAPDFAPFDEDVRAILAACPDALIFPRVNTSLSYAWTESHPEELCDFGFKERKCPCFSSDVWADEVKRELRLFIAHVRESDYAAHIVGYQLAGGNTEEWFPFDMRGSVGRRSREKFEAAGGGDGAAYYRFLSGTVASRIAEFAACVKKETERRLVVGGFYGYTFECVDRGTAHHALGRLLTSPDVDFLCSPISYAHKRQAGIDHAAMTAVDSIRLHGKLYFTENDTRTHLSAPPSDLPYFQLPVWYGPEKPVTAEIMKMHFARALVHGHAFWWFDMWGGWYADPDYLALVRRAREIAGASLSLPRTPCGRFAVFADETVYAHLTDTAGATAVCYNFRRTLGHAAAPYDVYLLSDEERVRGRYPAAVFLSPAADPSIAEAARAEQARGVATLTVTPENAGMSAADLRAFLRQAGVRLYADGDLTVYESESYLFIHTGEDGISVNLPDGARDLFGAEMPGDGRFPAGHSYLFRKEGNAHV